MYFDPELAGIAAHTTELANALVAKGNRVSVFTAMPFYPDWSIYSQYRKKLFMSENRRGIYVYRNWLYVPSNKKSISSKKRIIHEISFVFIQFINLMNHAKIIKSSDYVIIFSPPFLQGLTAVFLERFFNSKVIFHVEDIQPDSAIDLGMLGQNKKEKILINFLKWLERKFYSNCSHVSTLTHGMAEKIKSRLPISKQDVVLLPYWINFESFNINEQARTRFRKKIKMNKGYFLIGYAGNIGRKQNLDFLVKLAGCGNINPNIHFLICGDGAERHAIESLVKRKEIKNITLLPFLRGQDYIDFLNGIDLSYISQDENADKIFIPSKLYKTLACGSPVLCIANKQSELAHLIEESKSGIVFEFRQMEQIVRAINRLVLSPNKLKEMRINAFKYAYSNFSKDRILTNFLNSISVNTKKEEISK